MTEIAKELLVQYVVIVMDSNDKSTKNINLLTNVIKRISFFNIRLSVLFYTGKDQNTSQAILVANRRPSVFFVLGTNSSNFLKEVILNYVSFINTKLIS